MAKPLPSRQPTGDQHRQAAHEVEQAMGSTTQVDGCSVQHHGRQTAALQAAGLGAQTGEPLGPVRVDLQVVLKESSR